jgi:hypothetical protein
MKLTIIISVPVIAGAIFLATACRKRGPEADAIAAVGRGGYQFIALLDSDGKWRRPQFSDIPAWYFEPLVFVFNRPNLKRKTPTWLT